MKIFSNFNNYITIFANFCQILNVKVSTRGYLAKGEKVIGLKTGRERITALVMANMNGLEKPKLSWIIGKSKKPRGFPNDFSSLLVIYKHL